jgi:hypothetical protein
MKATLSIQQRAGILAAARLTGELRNNSRAINEQAIRELMAKNPYWSLRLKTVEDLNLEFNDALERLVKACGIDKEVFESHKSAYIDPATTVQRWDEALKVLDVASKAKETILFATGHPGSLLEFYRLLAERARAGGAQVIDTIERVRTPTRHYLDTLGGVIVLSDEGSLMHTHDDEGLSLILRALKPTLVVADHGYAAAAINEAIPTIAIFDTDDPALPLAASIHDNVVAIPMNDNQTNLRTANALSAVLDLNA